MDREIRKPPRWLAGLLLLLCLYHVGAVLWSLRVGGSLPQAMSVPILLQIILNMAWATAFAWGTTQLIYRRPYALNRSFWLLCGFLFFVAVRQVLFVRADYDRNRLPLMLIIMAVILAIFLIVRRLMTASIDMEKRLYDSDRSED